ncbi:signal peptide peptidase SppA [uncultured Porphyromonas sp.]|uniref:signal peptide peptidase SppA n=1 Tax=uncultured Porphyromonas sp. TaxID=159274 RepID=UPI002805339B|nr:signal peptide peptidase SppA [uncultured Porphyromonas sp.]
MNSFWKTFFATLLAIIVSCVIFVSLSIIALIGLVAGLSTSANNETQKIKNGSILKIDLAKVSDTYVSNPWAELGFDKSDGCQDLPLSYVLEAIDEAKNDDRIKGIYLNMMDPGCGYASAEALRGALEDFKQTGKFIVSYADLYSLKGYYLASVADQLYVNKEGSIAFDGLAGGAVFFKDLLDKIGVEMMVFKVGTFKSAVEPYMLNGMSEANRTQITSYLGDIWGRILSEVGTSRGLDSTRLQALADSMQSVQSTDSYLANKLIDGALYQDQALEQLCSLVNVDEPDDLYFVSLRDVYTTRGSNRSGEANIGVLFAEGEINIEQADSPFNTKKVVTDQLADRILEMAEDDDYDALVVRVNSPGGSSYISEQLWYAVHKASQNKPVVISMGDYAASGGYYMSSGASYIFAEPSTITGSIGIFGVVPNATKLANKIGVHQDVVKTARYADLGALDRPWTEEERGLFQQYVNRGYELFLKRVSEGRGMTRDQVDSIAQGRVWTGAQALGLGLVDELGGLQDAIAYAATQAGYDSYHVTYMRREVNLLQELFDRSTQTVRMKLMNSWFTEEEIRYIDQLRELRAMSGLQARLPMVVDL